MFFEVFGKTIKLYYNNNLLTKFVSNNILDADELEKLYKGISEYSWIFESIINSLVEKN